MHKIQQSSLEKERQICQSQQDDFLTSLVINQNVVLKVTW